VTAGPGFSNVLPAVISAYYARSPIIVLAGHSALQNINKHAAQEVDHLPLAKLVSKYAQMIYSTSRIPEYIQEAFRAATAENMGPAFLDLPLDIQTLQWEVDRKDPFFNRKPESYRVQSYTYPDPSLVKKITELLISASNPIIIAGSGVYWGKASENLLKVAEYLSIPVTSDELGKGCIPDLHPLAIGNAIQNLTLGKADLILALGVTFGEYLGFGTNPTFYQEDCKLVIVDPDAMNVGKNRPFEIGVASSLNPFLNQLLTTLKKEVQVKLHEEWAKVAKQDSTELELLFSGPVDSNDIPIKPQRLTKDIQPFLDKNTRLFLDGGDTTVWAQLILKASYPGQIIMSHGPTGHLGAGIPMAIAAKLAKPEKTIMVLTGDGSFLFNGAEIDTAVRYDLPIVIIVENDSAWGMIAHNQDLSWGERIGTTLDDKNHINYVKFAESLGGQGELVTRPEDISGAIKRACKSDTIALVDVRVDGNEINVLNKSAAAKADPSYWE
ncbi:MAG: thiamine pyrophosphate-binding protein, partial [Candidatus Hodarchaeota archaeon]